MYRYVIALAGIVVLLAVGAMAVVTLTHEGPPTDSGLDADSGEGAGETVPPADTVEVAPEQPSDAGTGETPKKPDSSASENVKQPKTVKMVGKRVLMIGKSTGKPGPVITVNTSMTPEARQQHAERMRRFREQAMYRLPTSYGVMRLERSSAEDLKPTEEQLEQLSQLKEQMRIRAQASLEDIVGQEEQLRSQMQELYRKRASVQSQLDAEYKDMLRVMLTADQMEVVEGRRKAYSKSVPIKIHQGAPPPPGGPDGG